MQMRSPKEQLLPRNKEAASFEAAFFVLFLGYLAYFRAMSWFTLRVRIFLSLLLTLAAAFALTGTVSFYHFKKENEDYHTKRLQRKESAVLSHIDYLVKPYIDSNYSPDQWSKVLSGHLEEISSIHSLDLAVYHWNSQRIAGTLMHETPAYMLPLSLPMRKNQKTRLSVGHTVQEFEEGNFVVSSSEVVNSDNLVELMVLIPYYADVNTIPEEDYEFLRALVGLYLLLFVISAVIAYIFSNYVGGNIKIIGDKLKDIRLNKTNEKLAWRRNDEIGQLIDEYNHMVDKLEHTAVELARNERESAWKEMAQQVAHEIKNPLTPIQLTLQMMERSKDLDEVHDLSKGLLEQVRSMVHIAEAFSRFAQMPSLVLETVDLSGLTERTCSMYADRGVVFTGETGCLVHVDKEQWSRVVHNLVTNALQSIPEERSAKVEVEVRRSENQVLLVIQDNGAGISAEDRKRVFEPNFTTKTSGMGLGLAMVKNLVASFGGTIDYTTVMGEGTRFVVFLPAKNETE
mgnify:CR=1 FL=1